MRKKVIKWCCMYLGGKKMIIKIIPLNSKTSAGTLWDHIDGLFAQGAIEGSQVSHVCVFHMAHTLMMSVCVFK